MLLTVPFLTDLCSKSTCFLLKDTGRRSCSTATFYALSFHHPHLFPFYQSLNNESTHYAGGINYLFCLGRPKFFFSLESILVTPFLACCPCELLHPPKKSERFTVYVQKSFGQELERGAPCSEMSVPDDKDRSPFPSPPPLNFLSSFLSHSRSFRSR